MNDTTMITAMQLATRLGICRQLVARYAAQGRIAGALKFGKAWMFPDDAKVTPTVREYSFKKIGRAPEQA